MTARQRPPGLYLSLPHPCGYFPERQSTIVFIDPDYRGGRGVFGESVRLGFRRSGDLIYRPHCTGCTACVPVRIPVREFRPSRAQQRCWGANQDLTVTLRLPGHDPEHFALYRRYQAARHPGSSMDHPDPERYLHFLVSDRAETLLAEFRDPASGPPGRLLAVAVTDLLPDGLSAMYTFFDPAERRRGLGTLAVMWQVSEAMRRGLGYVYLGYWIRDCAKMAYKGGFRPLEALRGTVTAALNGARWGRLIPRAASRA